jgi:hypothetical protein
MNPKHGRALNVGTGKASPNRQEIKPGKHPGCFLLLDIGNKQGSPLLPTPDANVNSSVKEIGEQG